MARTLAVCTVLEGLLMTSHDLMDDFSNSEEKVPVTFQCPLYNSPKVKEGLEYQGVEALP